MCVHVQVRTAALRSLTNLRVLNLADYLPPPLRVALGDRASHIRATAVLGVVKLYRLRATTCLEAQLLPTVSHLLDHDKDPLVLANALRVLLEVGSRSHPEYTPTCTVARLTRFLSRFSDFDPGAQTLILEWASTHYRPSDSSGQQTTAILNVLDDYLHTSHLGVFLGVAKLFLHLTLAQTAVHQEVLTRLAPPLLTFALSPRPEVAYVALSHLAVLVERAAPLFVTEISHLYPRALDASYVRKCKLDILVRLTDGTNAYQVVQELSQSLLDPHVGFVGHAVHAVAQITLQNPDVSGLMERFLSFFDVRRVVVTDATLSHLPEMIRRFPGATDLIVNTVAALTCDEIEAPGARAAYFWVLGVAGATLRSTPYVLLAAVGPERYAYEHWTTKLALMVATLRCFFVRPHETKPALATLLALGREDQDLVVREKAQQYTQLLAQDVEETQRLLGETSESHRGVGFVDASYELRDRLFEEFNSLSIIYGKTADTFVVSTVAAEHSGGDHVTPTPTSATPALDTLRERIAGGAAAGVGPGASSSVALPNGGGGPISDLLQMVAANQSSDAVRDLLEMELEMGGDGRRRTEADQSLLGEQGDEGSQEGGSGPGVATPGASTGATAVSGSAGYGLGSIPLDLADLLSTTHVDEDKLTTSIPTPGSTVTAETPGYGSASSAISSFRRAWETAPTGSEVSVSIDVGPLATLMISEGVDHPETVGDRWDAGVRCVSIQLETGESGRILVVCLTGEQGLLVEMTVAPDYGTGKVRARFTEQQARWSAGRVRDLV